jgi:putative aldouronate transport system substrate-binding protein
MDWLASPFGTDTWQFVNFGIKDRDYNVANGQPVLTNTGRNELHFLALSYIANSPPTLFYGGEGAYAKAQYDYMTAAAKNGLVVNPAYGLYAPSQGSLAAPMAKVISDGYSDIVQGRKKLADWDNVVSQWRKAGGDQVRKEYEQAYAATH